MLLAGLPIRDELVLELARLVDNDDLAERLESAYGSELKLLAVSFSDRDSILLALDDPPAGLEELRGLLLREREWRVREASSGCAASFARTPGRAEQGRAAQQRGPSPMRRGKV
jgi:hypothetical protein